MSKERRTKHHQLSTLFVIFTRFTYAIKFETCTTIEHFAYKATQYSFNQESQMKETQVRMDPLHISGVWSGVDLRMDTKTTCVEQRLNYMLTMC